MEVTNIIDLHTCIQGEGKFAGIPHILVRVSGCNLRCQFRDNICDTPYSSWFPENGKFTYKDVINVFQLNPQIKHTFITGGEPFLDPKNTASIIEIAKSFGHFVAAETNGSLYSDLPFDFVTISPKLTNSRPKEGTRIFKTDKKEYHVTALDAKKHERQRLKKDVLASFLDTYQCQFKFVVQDNEDIVEIKLLQQELNIPSSIIYLMPEGIKREQLDEKRKWVIEACIKNGFNYSDRLHIIAYNDKREA